MAYILIKDIIYARDRIEAAVRVAHIGKSLLQMVDMNDVFTAKLILKEVLIELVALDKWLNEDARLDKESA